MTKRTKKVGITGEEDRNPAAQQILVHILRKGHSEEAVGGHLEVQCMQEDVFEIAGGAYVVATPAAAATRSTIRRLREIAEV
ncbi:60S ribosomal protein L43 [Elasticomyces elasticus]|nr:60S ribosomal protein L43 [Elasticomyces elasticus]